MQRGFRYGIRVASRSTSPEGRTSPRVTALWLLRRLRGIVSAAAVPHDGRRPFPMPFVRHSQHRWCRRGGVGSHHRISSSLFFFFLRNYANFSNRRYSFRQPTRTIQPPHATQPSLMFVYLRKAAVFFGVITQTSQFHLFRMRQPFTSSAASMAFFSTERWYLSQLTNGGVNTVQVLCCTLTPGSHHRLGKTRFYIVQI